MIKDHPVYDHDCCACVFLGHIDGCDVYYCETSKVLVSRTSEDYGTSYQPDLIRLIMLGAPSSKQTKIIRALWTGYQLYLGKKQE